MKKDDMLEITIEDISSDGSGVGKSRWICTFCQRHDPGRSGESQNHENEKNVMAMQG